MIFALDYFILFLIIFGINLMPAFGPPTWSVILIYSLNTNIHLAALILIGAVAAALGRFLLALGFRHLRRYVPTRTKKNLVFAGKAIENRKRNSFIALGLFALSPLPSAQLFEAAGLTGVPLAKFTATFFAGRLISYSIYSMSAKAFGETTIGETFRNSLTSPSGLAIQIGMVIVLVVLTQIDWSKYFRDNEES